VPPTVAFLPPVGEGEPAPYVEAPAPVWGIAPEPDEETEPEALTVVASADEVEAAAAALDPWEQGPQEEPDDEGGDASAEAGAAQEDPEAEPAGRAGLFRRRRR
jgi:hypothetical protein